MISTQQLSRAYRDRVAVHALDFELESGAVLGLLGPNGAGKSTTLKMLTGALPPSAGTATVAGFDIFEDALEVRRRVGYLPELPPLYPDLTPLETLRYAAALKGIPKAQVAGAVDHALSRCGLEEVTGRRVGNLSKGFRQRVGLALALLGEPPVIILDEPTVGLDPEQIIETRELIRGLAGAHTVIVSTHILSEVSKVCDQVLVLSAGRQLAFDTLEGLQAAHTRRAPQPEGGAEAPSLEAIFLSLTAP